MRISSVDGYASVPRNIVGRNRLLPPGGPRALGRERRETARCRRPMIEHVVFESC